VDFDPGIGTYNLSVYDRRDVFIQKLDPLGNFLWAASLGGDENDWAYGDVFIHQLDLDGNFLDVFIFPSDANCNGIDMTIDANGNIYGVGNLSGTMDFDPNTDMYNLTSTGNSDAFVFKLGCAFNKILTSPTNDYVLAEQLEQRAGNIIWASNIIGGSASITYNAGNFIELLEGFEVQQGATFTTLLNGCN